MGQGWWLGVGAGVDFLSRSERERVCDFVETVTFHCMYMSIVRYGLFFGQKVILLKL